MTYQPPCTITPVIERLLGEICELVGRLSISAQGENLRLRRINRIRTIQGSLAIEGNTLSQEQITAILEGKHVVAPPREIQEARNAIEVYDRLSEWDPYKESGLLSAHEIMMRSLMDFPGRMGRLWQTLILAGWNPVFTIIPVESMVHARQRKYYEAIGHSTEGGDSAPFVEFMLKSILEVIENAASDQVTDHVTDQVKKLLLVMDDKFISVPEMMSMISLSHRPTLRKNYMHPMLDTGLIEMKYPENPKHPGQRYRLSAKGRRLKALLGEQSS
jgi:Fic family protein